MAMICARLVLYRLDLDRQAQKHEQDDANPLQC